jgi:hypothetical protein
MKDEADDKILTEAITKTEKIIYDMEELMKWNKEQRIRAKHHITLFIINIYGKQFVERMTYVLKELKTSKQENR